MDLAYDLPLDFDPFARPDPDDLSMSTGPGGASLPLAQFLSASAITSMGEHSMPVPDDIYNMPDLVEASEGSECGHADLLRSPNQAVGIADGLSVPEEAGRRMTLEEIGKKRHEDWLQSRGSSADW